MINYFSDEELECPCCHELVLEPGFREDINALRQACDHALIATSCCRCLKHNMEVGGKEASFHLINCKDLTGLDGACAMDITTKGWDGAKKWRFVKIAMGLGFSIGVDKDFIHVDMRTAYPETKWDHQALWGY